MPARFARTRTLTLTLLSLTTLLFAATAVEAAPTSKPKRCAKGTVVIGKPSSPVACLPAKSRSTHVTLAGAVADARSTPKGARRSPRAVRLARLAFTHAQAKLAAGQPVFTPAKRLQASASVGAPAGFGKLTEFRETSSGAIEASFEQGGVSLTVGVDADQSVRIDARDRHGAGGFVALKLAEAVPRCPSPTGDVPARFDTRITYGEASVKDRRRHVTQATVILDGPWHGYVGAGAKAERFDLALRSALELRAHVEHPRTGKVLRREGTQTFRAAVDRKRLAVGTSGRSLTNGFRLRGPRGRRSNAVERELLSALATLTAATIDQVSEALRDGDERWYEQRRCAQTFITRALPARVTRGDTASWQLQVTDAQGRPAAAARWQAASHCGRVSAGETGSALLDVSVVDEAGTWGPQPRTPACVHGEVTSTAGRAAAFSHEIEPAKPDNLRIAITLRYEEQMGAEVTPTTVTGSGSVELRWDQDQAEGTGTYTGTEWDGTLLNPCGHDMTATRSIQGTATTGVTRNDDGTLTVAWTANERPLQLAFMAILPPAGGTRAFYGEQPFCGEARRAQTTTDLQVAVTRFPAE